MCGRGLGGSKLMVSCLCFVLLTVILVGWFIKV